MHAALQANVHQLAQHRQQSSQTGPDTETCLPVSTQANSAQLEEESSDIV
jgi:hypothetical protein